MAIVLSCHKSNSSITAPASLNIINAIPTSQPLIPVFGTTDIIQYFSNTIWIYYGGYYGGVQLYSPVGGSNLLYVVQLTDTVPTKEKLFSGTLDLAAGSIYSFFLSGDTTKADTLLVQDHIPYYSDSTVGVRFVNLSTGSQPISVNLVGNAASQTEFSGLGYRQISSFKSYPATLNVGGLYTFEVRDQASGNLLYTYTWSYTVFRNNTLVISGSEDPASSTPLMVFAVNNY